MRVSLWLLARLGWTAAKRMKRMTRKGQPMTQAEKREFRRWLALFHLWKFREQEISFAEALEKTKRKFRAVAADPEFEQDARAAYDCDSPPQPRRRGLPLAVAADIPEAKPTSPRSPAAAVANVGTDGRPPPGPRFFFEVEARG